MASTTLCIGIAALPAGGEEPAGLFLTWQQDPTTTMTIDWHVVPDAEGETPRPVLHFTPAADEPARDTEAAGWREVDAETLPFPHSERVIHRAELRDLEPGTKYRFRADGFERTYTFRTMPEDVNEPLVFAVGGDTLHRREDMERMNRVAMEYQPQFIVWGGDLAYADGRADRVERWHMWFDVVMDTLTTDEGRVMPIVLAIGNHEMKRHLGGNFYYDFEDHEDSDQWRAAGAPYFFSLFAFPGQPGYAALDFGGYLSLLILDSNHANPVPGAQTDWLERALRERKGVPHIIPVYHVPAYPSVRSFDQRTSREIRDYWTGLFDEHGVRIAFENHDHAYKRTVPIRGGEPGPGGVVYLGDGAWGVGTRDVHDPEETWYLQRARRVRHGIIVTLHGPHQHVLAVSEDGEVIDEYPEAPAMEPRRNTD